VIRSIEIRNLRGIEHGELADLAPLTVLVGPNGSGKSTVLDALLIGADPSPGKALTRAVLRRTGLLDDAARWIRHGANDALAPEIVVQTEGGKRSLSIRAPPWIHPNIAALVEALGRAGHHGPYTNLNVHEQPGEQVLAYVAFAYDGAYGVNEASRASEVVPILRLIDSGQSYLSAPVTQRYTQLMREGQLQLAKDLIVALVPTAEDLRLGVDEAEKPVLHVLYKGSRGSTPLALAGDGIKLAVRVGLELAMGGGSVALLEEPETHLHPRAMWIVAQTIATSVKRGVQVILTTHSLDLLDALLAEIPDDLNKLAVFRTRLDEGKLIVSRIPGDYVAEARAVLHEDLR
jgi:energy-coupling factor transporter ATP-binding protein EcfA2